MSIDVRFCDEKRILKLKDLDKIIIADGEHFLSEYATEMIKRMN